MTLPSDHAARVIRPLIPHLLGLPPPGRARPALVPWTHRPSGAQTDTKRVYRKLGLGGHKELVAWLLAPMTS